MPQRVQGFFYRRFPGPLQCGAQGVTHKTMPRLIGNGQPIFLPQPWPEGLVTGKALGLGSAVVERLPYRFGQERRLTRGLGNRQHLGNTPLRLCGQSAPHGITMDPEQAGHLATGASLLGLEARERACKRCCLGASRSALSSRCRAAGVSWMGGRGIFMTICSSQEEGQHMAAHRVLRLCRIVNGKWY